MRVTVPGNILLAGEYMVTEEMGLGIAAAVEKRISLITEETASLEIHGRWGAEHLVWTHDSPDESRLFSAVVDAVQRTAGTGPLPSKRIIVDTSPFFVNGGRKRGFGSSAAVAAGLAYVLLSLMTGTSPEPDTVFASALSAHRAFQNGSGSGYDIAASVYGGIGVFTGGTLPSYSRIDPDLYAISLVRGRAPVSTVDAVKKYRTWKDSHPEEWQKFFEGSNAAVTGLAAAESFDEAVSYFLDAKKLGMKLGEKIGVPAAFKPEHPSDGQFLKTSPYKSVGAGNELAAVLFKERTIAPFSIAKEGIREE